MDSATAGSDAGVDESAGELCTDHDPERLWKGRQARLQRGQSACILEVQRDQVQHAEECRGRKKHNGVGRAEEPSGKQAEIDHGFGRPQLDEGEGDKKRGACGAGRQDDG
jgi:hypothetical protein